MFLLSLAVICLMLRRVMGRLDPDIRRRIALAAVMIFAFRAVPMLGEGYRWFAMDKLGFDEAFFGVLQLTGTGVGLAAMWLLTDAVVRRPPRTVAPMAHRSSPPCCSCRACCSPTGRTSGPSGCSASARARSR